MLKDRKKPTEHRQGNLVKLVDFMQRFSKMQYEKGHWIFDSNNGFDEGRISVKHQEELEDMMKELRNFDITKIGNLYLTSGGRIVLDKGYGEYFYDSDKVIFTLEQLKSGMSAEKFIKEINKLKVRK